MLTINSVTVMMTGKKFKDIVKNIPDGAEVTHITERYISWRTSDGLHVYSFKADKVRDYQNPAVVQDAIPEDV